MTKQLVKTAFGWHIIRKERIDDPETLLIAYKKVKALDAAHRLADRIGARVKSTPSPVALDRATRDAIGSDLGPKAAEDPSRPDVLRFASRPKPPAPNNTALTDCALVLSVAKGAVLVGALADDDGYVVATSRVETAGERADRLAKSTETDDDDDGAYHASCGTLGNMTPAQIKRLIELMNPSKEKL